MKYIKIGFCLFICYILQTTFFRIIFQKVPVPDLIFVLALCMSMVRADWFYASFIGLSAGLILDFTSQGTFGVATVFLMGACVGSAFLRPHFNKAKKAVNQLFVFAFSIAFQAMYYIFSFSIWGEGNAFSAIFETILPVSVLNTLFSFVIYPIAQNLAKKEEDLI